MPKILHLGFGNFHRAHQAWYTQRANAEGPDNWTIIGVAMTRSDLRDALAPSGYRYTLLERGAGGATTTLMTVHEGVLVVPEDPEAVIAAIANPEVQIVTLTVTEKGYGLDGGGTLDLTGAAIARDLRSTQPRTAVGLLAQGIARRLTTGNPLTVISCDNLQGNGDLLARAVADYAAAANLPIAGALGRQVRFPNTMVDRITPATTPEAIDEVAGLADHAEVSPVITEAFSEWVIEDSFATQRPAWERVGAQITQHVAPFELRKLRLLNASHSLLAYGGLLRGHDYVHEAIADPVLRAQVSGLWDEAQATLPPASSSEAQDYRHALLARFAVPEIRHALAQIAVDGSLKVPVRILPTIADRRAASQPVSHCLSALAAWIAFVMSAQDLTDHAQDKLDQLRQGCRHTSDFRHRILASFGWATALEGLEAELDSAIDLWRLGAPD